MNNTVSQHPTSSLIIPTRNRSRLVLDMIQSVLQGDELPDEILVADQSDTCDRALQSFAAAQRCSIKYLWTESRGLSRGRNLGAAASESDVLVFADDDMLAARDWYRELMQVARARGLQTAITGRVLPGAVEVLGGWIPSLVIGERPAVYRGRLDTDILAGGHMAVWRRTFNAVGRFDERLGAGSKYASAEDNDLGFRLLGDGYTIEYVPQAVLYHRAWRPSRDFLRVAWTYGQGKAGYYCKHFSVHDPYMLRRLIRDIGRRVLSAPWNLRHNRRELVGDIAYVTALLNGVVQWTLTER